MGTERLKNASLSLGDAFRRYVLEMKSVRRHATVIAEGEPELASVFDEGCFILQSALWPANFESVDHRKCYLQGLGVAGAVRLNLYGVDGALAQEVCEALDDLRSGVVAFLSTLRGGAQIAIGKSRVGDIVQIPETWWKTERVWFDVKANTLLQERGKHPNILSSLGGGFRDVVFHDISVFSSSEAPQSAPVGRKPISEKWYYHDDSAVRGVKRKLERALEQNEIADPVDYFSVENGLQSRFAKWLANQIDREESSVRRELTKLISDLKGEGCKGEP